ncbi:MAG TPA: hypothetical protein VFX48_04810, partial [Saprospiraceae bacterium]|nr:hypothetical protein [Saprospiraceae bacterium]
MKQLVLLLGFTFFSSGILLSQNWSIKSSVQLWVETSETPASITLNWVKDPDATNYYVYRKAKTATTWGNFIANVSKDSSRYTDLNVEVGKAYEYRVSRVSSVINAFGYVYAGIKLAPVEWRGSILLLVDSTVNARLKTELDLLKSDLTNEAWNVITHVPSARHSVSEIRTKIADLRRINPDLRSVFILGHVKVPYSGDLAPDAHPDHIGAWPSDTYYADLDGNWTDVIVLDTAASRRENRNAPGDGKFDQSIIPTDVELEVGRVDFFNLPAFSKTEIELLRSYLQKNHSWRTGMIKARHRGIVQDNFNFRDEAFGQSGIKNFSVFFSPSNVITGGYRDSLVKESYMWSYGSGGGSYTSAGGISTTQNMTTDSLQTVFTFLFGSYFGDWDSPNNFLRSTLASGTVLTNAWAGRPVWAAHHMAMGDPIGYAAKVSTNNSTTYNSGFAARGVHMALMGDPSLTMYPVAAPASLTATESGPHIALKWRKSADATDGYYVYRRITGNTIFDVVAKNLRDTVYEDPCISLGFTYEYMIRAVKLEKNASGSFFNLSAGVRDTITKMIDAAPHADFTYTRDFEFIHLKSESKNTRIVKWVIGKDTLVANEVDAVLDCNLSAQEICLIAEGDCENDIECRTIPFDCSAPKIIKLKIDSIPCPGGVGAIEIQDLQGADPFAFKWSNGSTSNGISGLAAGKYSVTITSAKNTETVYEFDLVNPDPITANVSIRSATPGKKDGGITGAVITGGTPPYTYRIPNENIDSLAAGSYDLIITDAHQCMQTIRITVPVRTATEDSQQNLGITLYPSVSKDYIFLNYNG